MPAKRPTIISVIGILNIVLGSLGLISFVCCGVIGIFATHAMGNIKLPQQPGQPAGPNPFAEMSKQMSKLNEVPGFLAVQVGGVVVAALTGTLLIVSGIGFLKMKQWGRMAGLAYAVVGMLWGIAAAVIQITILGPAMTEFNNNLQAQMGQNNQFMNNPAYQNISTIMQMAFNFAYPVAMLVLMLLPAIKDALAGKGVVVEDNVDELDADLADGSEQ